MVCGGLRWFVVVCGGLWWFVVDCGGLSFSHTRVELNRSVKIGLVTVQLLLPSEVGQGCCLGQGLCDGLCSLVVSAPLLGF